MKKVVVVLNVSKLSDMGHTLFADKIYQVLFNDLDFKSVATFLPLLQNRNKDLKEALLANGLWNATSLIEERR